MLKKYVSLILAVLLALCALCVPASAYMPYNSELQPGDVNSDKTVAAGDALLALQHAVGKIFLDYDAQGAADTDGDFAITASDALKILQCAVGKITLLKCENPYDNYELNYVEPTGLTENTLYVIHDISVLKYNERMSEPFRMYMGIMGLVNRNVKKHKIGMYVTGDTTDSFWLDYMRSESELFGSMEEVALTSLDEVLETFIPFIKQCGIIAWDPAVPSTLNVAGTICGLDNYLPVMYDTSEGSFYTLLTEKYGVEVKQSLVGLFGGAKEGGKITDTDLVSSGSPKCDAYLWALDKYMSRCNPELIAYTLDGATVVPGSNVINDTSGAGGGAFNCDYFVQQQCFFCDLTSYPAETPNDEPDQPLGADAATFKRILKARYDLSGGRFGTLIGFPPWSTKYTNSAAIAKNTIEPTRLEWHFVETCTAFNCGIEADAPVPDMMTNASLFSQYEITHEPKGNAPADDTVKYDPDTKYYAVVYSGDFDCSPWLKARAPAVWSADKKRGTVYMTYSYNVNLLKRIPVVFDYIWGVQSDKDFFTAGEGMAYIMPSMLFNGATGKEQHPTTRTLANGDLAYYQYARPYYEYFGTNVTGRLINGFSVMSGRGFDVLSAISPDGVFVYETSLQRGLSSYNGTVFAPIKGVALSSDTNASGSSLMVAFSGGQFASVGFYNQGANYGSAVGISKFVTNFEEYASWKKPGQKYEYVSLTTYIRLINDAGTAAAITG